MRYARVSTAAVLMLAFLGQASRGQEAARAEKLLKIGIIGLDSSHAIEFTKIINEGKGLGFEHCRVLAAYPKGSRDIESSVRRVPGYMKQVQRMGVEIVDTIPELLGRVDAVLLESNDGRPHLEQAVPVIRAGKPLFVDKPLAGSLADCVAIMRLAERHNVPVFSSSALRYVSTAQELRSGKHGKVVGCDAFSPCPLEPTHPDLYWYGIHGVETLYTVMGPGCKTVTRVSTEGTDVVVGVWKDGRVGVFRGMRVGKRGYGGVAYTDKAIVKIGSFEGYEPLLVQVVEMFRTGKVPVDYAETLELYAFMSAADVSKQRGGVPVSIEEVVEQAERAADAKLAQLGQ